MVVREGFAAVDALVALLLLATTLSLVLGAQTSGRKLAAAAVETRLATVELGQLLDRGTAGEANGRTGPFVWRSSEQRLSSTSETLCARRAEVRATRSGRVYRMRTTAPCSEGTAVE